MSKDDELIEIKILNEEEPALKAETPTGGALSSAAQKMGQAAQSAAQKAWESDTRKKVTGKVSETAAKQKDAISEAVSKAVNERIDLEKERMKRKVRETDWKEVAKKGAAAGLKAVSAGLAKLSQKLNNTTTAADDAGHKSTPPDNDRT